MCILFPIVAATVLVTIGYFALWISSQANNQKGMAIFGKVLSIILFVMAGLVLVFSITCGPRGHGKMRCMGAPGYMSHCPGEMRGMMGDKRERMGKNWQGLKESKELNKTEIEKNIKK